MTEPPWSAGARKRIDGRSLVLVGIGIDQIRGFASAGGRVVGGISVVPSGSPATEHPEAFPVHTLSSTTRDILEHVVWAYAATIRDAGSEVAEFLDRADPEHTATVAGYLPVPHECLGGRAAWIVDSSVSLPLEGKVGPDTPLAGVVPVIPSVRLPEGPPGDWWDELCSELDAGRLVVQAAGVSGGGTGTYICTSPNEVPALTGGFVAPFIEGMAGNAMGVVDDEGITAVFPASRQLLRADPHGRPIYAGNVTGERWAQEERDAIGDDVRAVGQFLAAAGFFGPFGVDFIRRPDGRRLYHDLNPRMNGVVDSLSRLIDSEATVPLVSVVLSRPQWSSDEISALEDTVHGAATRSPLARLWLTSAVERPRTIASVPASGRWWVDPTKVTVSYAGGDTGSWGDDQLGPQGGAAQEGPGEGFHVAELQPTLPAGLELRPGDRLVLGNLYCDVAFAELTNESTGPALVDAFLA
jgi:hypothetical protein